MDTKNSSEPTDSGRASVLIRQLIEWSESGFLTLNRLTDAVRQEPALSRMTIDPQGNTLLMLAANCADAPAVEFLLPLSETSAVNKYGKTALMVAVSLGARAHACVKLLSAASVLDSRDQYGTNALMEASRRGHETLIPLLLTPQTARAQDTDGHSALGFALLFGHIGCARQLFALSDLQARTALDETLLMLAATWSSTQCILALLPQVDAMAVDKQGACAIDYAMKHLKEEDWATAAPGLDALAVHSPRRAALAARARLPAGLLGHFEALLEREALQDGLSQSGPRDDAVKEECGKPVRGDVQERAQSTVRVKPSRSVRL